MANADAGKPAEKGKTPEVATSEGYDEETPKAGPWIGAATPSRFVFASSGEQQAAIWVDVPKTGQKTHVPTALTLVIDTSGSMRGKPIEHAREAARKLVDKLDDGDVVALYTFSDSAEMRVAATTLDSMSRRRIMNVIEELDARGGTNLFDGLNQGGSQLARSGTSHPVRRLVLISDGKATVGPTDLASFGHLADTGFGSGVQITSIGVGIDYDEVTLNTLAVRSSGRLHHVEHSDDLTRVVQKEMDLIDGTMATDAAVEIVAAPGVRLLGADGVNATWGGAGRLRVPVGAMFGGQTRELTVRFMLDERKEETRTLLSARLVFKDPHNGGVERVQEALVQSTVTGDEALLQTAGNVRAQNIVATQRAAQLATRATAQLNAGDFRAADLELARAEAELKKNHERAKGKADRSRALAQVQQMQKARKSVATAAAAPPSAKPKASRAGALDANEASMKLQGF
jgi:Ca-activated chloride channel family protein